MEMTTNTLKPDFCSRNHVQKNILALAGVAQWIEHQTAGSIPGQGTSLGCRPGPR